MLSRVSLVILTVALVNTFGVVGCGNFGIPNQGGVVSSSDTPQPPTGGTVVAVPAPGPVNQPPGSSDPGGATGGAGGQPAPTPQSATQKPGTMHVYADITYNYSVGYPADYVIRPEPAQKLAQLTPTPLAAIRFLNPVLAASTVPDEPADLEIRVYSAGQSTSLGQWLTLNGFAPAGGGQPQQPFHTPHVSGVQVCSDTMIAPGCSFFVLGGSWVYQLIPAAVTGEEMINTFKLNP